MITVYLLTYGNFRFRQLHLANFSGSRSPMKPIFATTPTASNRSSGADMFAVDSDVDATPKVTKQPMKEQRIFNMPDID